jgi:imidazolonepropionase-like amidohydrolase
MIRAASLALAVAFAAPATAQTIYITADRMLDVRSGRMVDQPALLIENGRIKSVGTQASVAAPAEAQRIALPGMTLLPGLIDMHVHMTSRADVHGFRRLTRNDTDAAIDGVVNAKITLDAGFTTVRNVGAPGFSDVSLKKAIEAGTIVGPRMFVSGPTLSITGGHGDNNLLPREYNAVGGGVADGPWEVRKRVRENRKFGADLIKYTATGGVLSANTALNAVQFSVEEMRAIVDEAKQLGMRVAVHAHGTAGIKNAIAAGATTIEHASFIDDEGIQMAKERGTWLSMDIYNTEFILGEGEKMGILPESLAKEREVGQRQRESFRRAVQAGAKIVYGTDAGVYPHGQNGRQFRVMVAYGATPLQSIQAATLNAADAMGQLDNLGVLEPGRLADMIAVPGNPLQNVRLLETIPVVIKGGAIAKDAR